MWRLATYNLPTNRGRRRPGARFDDPARGWYEMCPMKPESEIAGDVRADASPGHRDSLSTKKSQTINDLLKWAPASAIVRALDGRITCETVRDWTRGKSLPALWVAETIADKIERKARAELDLANRLRECVGPGRGCYGTKQLSAWRERKARERDEKEKADG